MTKAVVVIRWTRGITHTEQREQRRQHVEGSIGERTEQSDRAGLRRRIDFEREQEQGHAYACDGGLCRQIAMRVVVVIMRQAHG